MIYALVNNDTSLVENMVAWDGSTEYNPAGTLVQTDKATFGDKYENGQFYRFNAETQQWDLLG